MIKQGLWRVVAVGLSFSVFAETVDDAELTCDTEWTIAKGETKHVEYLCVDAPVTLTVKGGGTLELAVVDAPDLTIRMFEGNLKTVRPETMAAPTLDAGDWAYHLDASAKSTIVNGESLRDGLPTVEEWDDVDAGLAFPPRCAAETKTCVYLRLSPRISMYSEMRPWVRAH